MPRKTKAELQAEREQFRLQQIERERQEYFPLLMKTLEMATTAHYKITVREGNFDIVENEWSNWRGYRLNPEYTEDNYIVLENFKYDVETRLLEIQEAERKESLRRTALAKLTDEERELLNIKV